MASKSKAKSILHAPIVEPQAVKAPIVARPKCTQCGKSMAHLPFLIEALTCRDCYGVERYHRVVGAPIGAHSAASFASDEKVTA